MWQGRWQDQQLSDLFIWDFLRRFQHTVQVILWRVVGRAEETSTYSWCRGSVTANCRPTASNYQLSHLRSGWEPKFRSQRWEARVSPLCHRGPNNCQISRPKSCNRVTAENGGPRSVRRQVIAKVFKTSLKTGTSICLPPLQHTHLPPVRLAVQTPDPICTGHITTASFMGGGNQYIQLVCQGFCTVNCRPTASNYQLSRLNSGQDSNSDLRGGRRGCYHSATVAPDSDGSWNFFFQV